MLTIKIPPVDEAWDERTEQFVPGFRGTTLKLEHSLVSVSKWEAKYKKPFLEQKNRTKEELMYYIKCMTITQNVDNNAYYYLTEANYRDILAYIEDSMSATFFPDDKFKQKNKRNREAVTSELIYYWMTAFNIPFECEKWHLNRLIALVRICSEKNAPSNGKKMSKRELFERNRAINEANKKRFHTKG